METLGMILSGIGMIGIVVGGLWMLLEQFNTSILWGLACLFIPLVSLFWLALYWDEGKTPFGISALSLAMFLGGMVLSGELAF